MVKINLQRQESASSGMGTGARQEAGCVPSRGFCISDVGYWGSVLFIK